MLFSGLENVTLSAKPAVGVPDFQQSTFPQPNQTSFKEETSSDVSPDESSDADSIQPIDETVNEHETPLNLKLNPLTYDLTQGIVEQQPTCSKLLDLKEVPTVDIRASYHGENVIVQHQQPTEQNAEDKVDITPPKCDDPATEQASSSRLSPNVLKELLQRTIYGKQLLQTADTHCLSDSGRKLVVDTVARYHLTLNRKTSAEAVEDLSEVIVGLFTKEKKVVNNMC
ncbi:uncharacterized protein LOC110679875 [Aedes aegypti]|uniref:Uncharacterized protein n=1 Tax=Aedes aegypti TaxID=7159 RepID=A0A6I8UA26_AEDAE|nr:uncharacterized protein LOC110679875 [Aedes aegypti]